MPGRLHVSRDEVTGRRILACLVSLAALTVPGLAAGLSGAGVAADRVDDPVRRVVVVSVDGLASAAVRRLGPDGAPALHRMRRAGVSTLNARTARESTSTLPNHTGMVTGRRVSAAAGGHGVDFNHDTGGTVHVAAGEYVSCVFSSVHDRGGSTALYANKSKFAVLDRSWNGRNGARDRVGRDQGRDKLDRYVYTPDAGELTERLVRQLRRDPATFSFLHLRLPDSAGHASGYLSGPYLQAVRQADALVGRVVSTINRRRALRRHTVVVLTADHGGSPGGTSHSDPTVLGHYRVPFLVWGATVARGRSLYALSPARRNPGDRRTSYRGRQPVRNADVANLATDLLDLPAVPGSRHNSRHDLHVHAR
jgi:hypothetical protein